MSLEFAAMLGFGAGLGLGVGVVCGVWAMSVLTLGRKRAHVASDEPEDFGGEAQQTARPRSKREGIT